MLVLDIVPVDPALLFAVDAGSPQGGVRGAERLNLTHDLVGLRLRCGALSEIASPIVPTGTIQITPSGAMAVCSPSFLSHALALHAEPGSQPKRNSVPSRHIRCRITASLRATATRARARPRRATLIP